MLRITVSNDSGAQTCKLEGKLSGPWVHELERCFESMLTARQTVVVDLRGISFVDGAGKALLQRMHERGAKLIACTPWTHAIVEEISRGHGSALKQKRLGGIAVAFLITFLGGARLLAQQVAQQPDTLRLTLRDAVQLALKQNPQVQIANLNVDQSQQDVKISRSGLLPEVTLDAFEQVRRLNLAANIGRGFPGFAQHVGPFEVFQAGPNFSVPVFDLHLWRRWQASKANVSATSAQEQSVREQTAALIVSQYLGSLRAAADVKAAQSRVDLAQALYTQAGDLQKSGVGTGIDTLRANVELQNEKQRLLTSQTQLKTLVYGLARLLNLKPEQNIELADEVSFFQTPAFALDQSIQSAAANRPEMKALAARSRQLERQKESAKAARLPTVRVNGQWGYQGLSPQTSIPAYIYGVNVDVPVFTGGRIQAETTRADLELRKLEQQRQDQLNQIVLEVKTAAAQLESARSEVDVANSAVDLAREEVNQARDRFLAGVANNIEVVTAQDAFSRASDNQILALYRYNQARADLARATGQMENTYGR